MLYIYVTGDWQGNIQPLGEVLARYIPGSATTKGRDRATFATPRAKTIAMPTLNRIRHEKQRKGYSRIAQRIKTESHNPNNARPSRSPKPPTTPHKAQKPLAKV
jgi:hypothetical protein